MADRVTIELRNTPAESVCWQLVITDWNAAILIRDLSGKDYLDIGEVAVFDIPDGIMLPLRIIRLQICKWNEDMTALIQLYYIQSYLPTLWDWDKMQYGDEPDPSYRELFIPGPGSYYFDVNAESITPIGVAPVVQDWFTPIAATMMLMVMATMVMPMLQEAG